jgi:NAD(P)-dependent dehydrogenase (short-subunit alcohol dehydrogenase family)
VLEADGCEAREWRRAQSRRPGQIKAFEPMKRAGAADEVAHAILWLLSNEASYKTGASVAVTLWRQAAQ